MNSTGVAEETRQGRTRRLFFALWPSEAQQRELARATRGIVESAGGRAMPVGNLHLTLAFIGSVAEDALPAVRSAAQRASDEVRLKGRPIVVVLDRIDHWRKSQIVCATASGPAADAADLAERLKRALVDRGLAPDLKAFRTHVTLARKVARVSSLPDVPAVTWTFGDFSLVDSRSGPAGSIYSVIDSWPLCAR